jgi:hypothetical protein
MILFSGESDKRKVIQGIRDDNLNSANQEQEQDQAKKAHELERRTSPATRM